MENMQLQYIMFFEIYIFLKNLLKWFSHNGSLISERFHFDSNLQNLQKWVPNHHPEYTIYLRGDAQDNDSAPLLGNLSQNEKLSEIKPPLRKRQNLYCNLVYPLYHFHCDFKSRFQFCHSFHELILKKN